MPATKILLLGSGFVAGPCAEYLVRRGHELTIACRTLSAAESLCSTLSSKATPLALDATSPSALSSTLTSLKIDIVISLIPYIHHATVIRAALEQEHLCHVVTTSFVSPAVMELDEACKKKGVVVMNEMGVDPGMDLLWAQKAISKIHAEGGKVITFTEMAGALPAPDCAATSPLLYKFSWAPLGSLRALNNPGLYIQDGQAISVEGTSLMSTAIPYSINDTTFKDNLVGYANRDSTSLVEILGIPEAKTVFRGTMRYKGFEKVLGVLQEVGMLSLEAPKGWQEGEGTWLDVWGKVLGCEAEESSILAKLQASPAFTSDNTASSILTGLKMLAPTPVKLEASPLETFASYLGTLPELLYDESKGERDLMLMQIKIEAETSAGEKQTHVLTLEQYGVPGGASAMATTVGVPCGVAVQAVIDGVISTPGVQGPYDEKVCAVLRDMIEAEGLGMVEEVI